MLHELAAADLVALTRALGAGHHCVRDAAVRVFTDHGWHWGGYWRTPQDYQHFECGD